MCRFLLVAYCSILTIGGILGQEAPVQHRSPEESGAKSPAQIASAVGRATVLIRASLQGGSLTTGSGFIADPSGTIVTNFHVVEGAERVEVRLPSGDVHEVSGVRAVDRRRDIAILQIPAFGLPTAPLGNSDSIQPGDRVVVIGNALGVLDNTVTAGVISGVRDLEGYKLFQMDAAISKGNSGGPVVNDRGDVVGITVAKIEAGESLNFAIPVNYARGLLQLEPVSGIGALRGSGEPPGSLFANANQGVPRRWKSLASGTTKIVRVEGDFVYIETVLSEQFAAAGGMILAELKKQGEKWTGSVRSRIPCSTGDGVWTRIKPKTCSFEHPMEITGLTRSRIEGTVVGPPSDAQLRCRPCTYSEPDAKQEFVWIPE